MVLLLLVVSLDAFDVRRARPGMSRAYSTSRDGDLSQAELKALIDGSNEGKVKPKRPSLLRDNTGVPIERIQPGVNIRARRPPEKPKDSGGIKSGGSGSTGKILNQGKARVQDIKNPSRLKIIGGAAKGKKIDSPGPILHTYTHPLSPHRSEIIISSHCTAFTDVYLRPMMAKVREALFRHEYPHASTENPLPKLMRMPSQARIFHTIVNFNRNYDGLIGKALFSFSDSTLEFLDVFEANTTR